MINKKRVFIFGAFLLCLFFLMTFAGGRNEEVAMKTVEFIDGFNNETISLQEVEVGEDAEVPEEPVHENYVFAGWYLYEDQEVRVTDFTEILEDLTVIGKYADDKNNNGIADDVDDYYNVVFVDSVDNTIISTQTVLEGLDATAPLAPIHNGFTFVGWSRGYTNVRENITVNALYILNEEAAGNEVVLYEVTFIDGENDEVIEVQEVQEGLAATLPEPPVHENRVFDHWEGEYEEIVEDTEITAIYVDDLNNDGIADEEQARVIFNDYDGKELYNNLVTIGEETPTIEEPTREYYEFTGWDKEVAEIVTEDATYTATYTPINDENNDGIADEEQARVIFNDYDGKELYNNLVTIGEETPIVEEPTREYYEFTGWDKEVAEFVTEDATYTATYTPINDENNDGIADEEQAYYTVTYVDYDGIVLETYENILVNLETPIVEEPTREYYEFTGWDKEVAEFVTEDATYTATYMPINDENNDGIADEEQAYYTVTYVDYDGTVLETYENILVNLETPTIEEPTREYYEFTGWDKEVAEFVTEDATYTATYTPINDENNDGIADEEQAYYTVTYVDYDGTVLETYENILVNLETPTIEEPTREYYEFTGWDKEVAEIVTEDVTYTATYAPINDENNDGIADEEQAYYTVTYVDYDGIVLETYENILVNLETPIVEEPTREYYEFTGWDKEVAEFVTEDATYTATYMPINDENNDGIADEEQAYYTVTYADYDGTVLETYENILVNLETPTIEEPTREYYEFTGWDKEVAEFVTEDVTYTATYTPINDLNNNGNPDELDNTYVVNFYDFDKQLIKTEMVLEGLSANAPEMALVNGYTFTGWDKAFDNVNSDLEVYAVYVDDIKPLLQASATLYNDAQNASISALANDANGIRVVKVLKGAHEVSAFVNAGEEMTLNNGIYTMNALTENGYYTIYAEDNNGNASVQTVLVEGIVVLEGDFEDLYATGTFGSLGGFPIIGTYRRNLTINTKQNVKIADARVYVGSSYATLENFENNINFGDAIEHTENNLTYQIEGRWLNRVTIYVNYEYKEEIAPGVFETRYISKLYKTRLTYWFGDN